jgi:Putative threonine/serine exporter
MSAHGPGAGPHFLNSALDLNRGCIHLGIARLAYAGLIVVAIASGLLLGLTLLGVSLPVAYLTLSMPIDGANWGQPGLLSTKREGRPHVS